jgi:hypothetical protein
MPLTKNKVFDFLKKISVCFLVLSITIPNFSLAQTITSDQAQQLINEGKFVGDSNQKSSLQQAGYTFPNTSNNSIQSNSTPVTTTSTGNINSTTGSSEKTYSGAGTAVSGVAACSVGQLLANLVGSTVGTAINSITGSAKNYASKAVSNLTSVTEVPVDSATANKNQSLLTFKFSGGGDSGGVLQNFLNSTGNVSWDSIGFCIANEMIKYIGNSTIEWIKGGFKGSPVFVDNPESFFTNIAEQEGASFIRQIVGETTGIDVCQPFKVQLAIDTIGTVSPRGSSSLSCSLSSIKNNYEGFVSGDFSQGGLPGWFELIQPQNNYWGAREIARSEALAKITKKQNTATIELNWSKGYKSFKVCTTSKDENGNCKNRSNGTSGEETTTLGGYIEHTVNERSTSPQRRLEIAQTFDGVVSALVNELIKIAVNKTFEDDSSSEAETSLSAYCSVTPAYPKVGDVVTYSAGVYGGTGSFTYAWSGGGIVSGNVPSVSTIYNTEGSKTVSVVILSGNQSLTRTCSTTVYPLPVTTAPTSAPSIATLSKTNGGAGESVTITGTGFSSTSKVIFKNVNSGTSVDPEQGSSSASIIFKIPARIATGCNSTGDTCSGSGNTTPGVYQVYVLTDNRVSDPKDFTVLQLIDNGGMLI